MLKRYQYYAMDGTIKWTKWFETKYDSGKWQFKNKLLNEYRKD